MSNVDILEYPYPDFDNSVLIMPKTTGIYGTADSFDWTSTVTLRNNVYNNIALMSDSLLLDSEKRNTTDSWTGRMIWFSQTEQLWDSNKTFDKQYTCKYISFGNVPAWSIVGKYIYWMILSSLASTTGGWTTSSVRTINYNFQIKVLVQLLHTDWTLTNVWNSGWITIVSGSRFKNGTTYNTFNNWYKKIYSINTNWVVALEWDMIVVSYTVRDYWTVSASWSYTQWWTLTHTIMFWRENSTISPFLTTWSTSSPMPTQISIN